MNTSSHPGERLRAQRLELGLTQSAAATNCGVSREMWGKYERGEAKPGSDVLTAMSGAGFDVPFVLTGTPAALRGALADLRIATESAAGISGTREEIAEYQTALLKGLKAQRREEADLIDDYRKCAPPDQKTIRQMAARLASDTAAESAPKKKRT